MIGYYSAMPPEGPRTAETIGCRHLRRAPFLALTFAACFVTATTASAAGGASSPAAPPVAARPGTAAELAERLERGERSVRTGKVRLAEEDLRRALELGEELGDPLAVRRSLRWLGEAVVAQGRNADDLHRRLLALARRAGDLDHEGWARLALAQSALERDDFDRAGAEYGRALDLFLRAADASGQARAAYGLGRVAGLRGKKDEQLKRYAETESLARAAGDLRLLGRLYNAQGSRVFYLDPGTAVTYWRRSADAYQEAGDQFAITMPLFNLALADTYAGRLERAAITLDRLLVVCRAESYQDREQEALVQLAIVRRLQGRLDESLRHLDTAFALPVGGPDNRVDILEQRAIILLRLGRPADALELIAQAAASFSPPLTHERRRTLFEIEGNCLRALGRTREALALYLSAGSLDIGENALTTLRRSVPVAECYRELGQPDSALMQIGRATVAWESLRVVPKDVEWRTERSGTARRLYAVMAAILLEHPRERTQEERTRTAFDAVQRFKARTLRERVVAFGRPSPQATLGDTLVTAEILQQRVLRPGELFLDAFVGLDESYLFTATRDTMAVTRFTGRDSLRRRILDYLAYAAERPARGSGSEAGVVARAGSGLARDLFGGIEPLLSKSTHLVFSADDNLHNLPLAALPFPNGEPLSVGRQVSFTPSASVLAALRARVTGERSGRVLIVSGDRDPAGRRLAGAAQEAKWVEGRYRRAARSAVADSGSWEERLRGFDVLHFVSHIDARIGRPWEAGFPGSPDSAGGDTTRASGTAGAMALSAGKISGFSLSARLCVLSGCRSGLGMSYAGEGVAALASSFVQAGVPSVIGSLWAVDDRVTSRLVQRFYENLERGATAAEALRRAQLSIRRSASTRHPFYWAGFFVLGDADARVPLDRNPQPTWIPLSLGILGLAGLAGWWVGRRRRSVTAAAPVSTTR